MDVKNAIQQLAKSNDEIYCRVGTVDALDETLRTIDVTPVDGGAQVLAVRLQPSTEGTAGLCTFPALSTDDEPSYVVVGFLNNAEAVMLLADKIDKILYTQETDDGNISLEISAEGIKASVAEASWVQTKDGITIKKGDLTLEIDGAGQKIGIGNGSTNLLQLFTDLKALIEGIKVTTPAGPSTNLLPDTIAALTQFETSFKQLLK